MGYHSRCVQFASIAASFIDMRMASGIHSASQSQPGRQLSLFNAHRHCEHHLSPQ